MPIHLQIHLFGAPALTVDRVPVTRFHSAKVAALLYYLAATHRTQARESLATLLWTDLPADQAKKNLRGALYHLPATLGPFLEVTRDAVALRLSAPDSVDSVLFSAHLHAAERLPPAAAERVALLEEATRLYGGEFLQGFSVHDAEAFDEWLRGEREHFHLLAVQALNDLVVYHAVPRHNLPAELTTLVGRAVEVAQVAAHAHHAASQVQRERAGQLLAVGADEREGTVLPVRAIQELVDEALAEH